MCLSLDEVSIVLIALMRLRTEYQNPQPVDDLIDQFMIEYRNLININGITY